MTVRAAARHRAPDADVPAIDRLRLRCGCPRFALTEREEAVLELLARGMSTREIGALLYVSHQAVTYHVGNLLGKFQCNNRTGLVSRAFVLGVLSLTWPPQVVDQPVASRDQHPPWICGDRLKDSDRRRTSVST